MPTVLRWNGYRFYFFSNERGEPPHLHIDKGGRSAKFWLSPVALARNFGYPDRELNKLHAKMVEHEAEFLRAWNEHASRKA
jgi:Domain of unknown function (DUF4160)